MRIELTEVLACPACLPDEQGLVAFVDERAGGRILAGHLGCPRCDARHAVRGGAVRFAAPSAAGPPEGVARASPSAGDAAGPGGGSRSVGGAGRADAVERPAVEAAALLGLAEGSEGGVVLLDEGLAGAAGDLAALAPDLEVLALVPAREAADDAPSGPAAERVTPLSGAPPGPLPVRSGRLRGVALLGGTAERVREGARALGPGGRLVVLRPVAEAVAAAEEGPLRVLAAEERALVAHVAGPGEPV